MKPLLRAWGVDYDSSKVVLDRALAQAVQTSRDPRNPVVRYPIWLHLEARISTRSDQVTANLQALNLASVGALAPLKGRNDHVSSRWSAPRMRLRCRMRCRPTSIRNPAGSDERRSSRPGNVTRSRRAFPDP